MKKLLLLVTFFTLSICGVFAQNDTMYVMKDGNIIYSIPVKPSDVDSIVFYRLPTIKVTGVNTICAGKSTRLTASGGVSYTWSPSTGLSSTTGASVEATPTFTTTYTVTGIDQYGYKNTETITVTVNDLPIVLIADEVICLNDKVELKASGGISYLWKNVTTGLSSTTISNPEASPTITTTYTVEVTGVNNCVSEKDVKVTVNDLPTISITGISAINEGQSTVLTASGGASYVWGPSTNLSVTTGTNVTASPTETTTYTVTGTDVYGCSNTSSITINVTEIPTSVTDVEGNTYKVVTIGSQTWMAENLKVTKYNDGTAIPLVTSDNAWRILDNTESPAYCYYDNDVSNKDKYGALYNWYAVSSSTNGGKNVCPSGWHVPSDAEWTTLTDYIGSDAGTKLKATSGWKDGGNGTDAYGFSGVPGGFRGNGGNFFPSIGSYGYWWSSTSSGTNFAWYRILGYNYSNVSRGADYKAIGYSVRCVRD